MAIEMLQRDDLTVYVVAGMPKSFLKKLRKIVEEEGKNGEAMQVDPEMAEWMISRLRGEKRRAHEQTPASSALWRAYSALSAARYHLQDRPEEEQVRELRNTVEELWREFSPLFKAEEEEESEGEQEETGSEEEKS